MDLSFNPQMNIFCGPNGVGKTTILEIIAHSFAMGQSNIFKKNVNTEIGKVSIKFESSTGNFSDVVTYDTFVANQSISLTSSFHGFSNEVISLKSHRNFTYIAIKSVDSDATKEASNLWHDAINGINLIHIKAWFVNRYLYSPHKDALSKEQLNNYELAKSCFSFLNEEFTFSRVDAASNDIMINTPNGEIYYKYLSSGFKSIISILFGIIKEIEFRFVSPRINAEDFEGIILIDEVELHLHPEWQEKIVDVLLKVFPKAQFFTTTHSPHIIQTAQPNHIIALETKNKRTVQRQLPNSDYGFQGWTIEEVLTDVMGMNDNRTEIFKKLISEFEKSIDEENHDRG